ncbi:hypothetical protein DSL64_04640 [Dyadobacter luteus]|uniref:DUF4890 domain-containing protein n=1 Tax=Dyadobacter luteus TaxID=2259619 RepID=A0A3D8YGF3_9BACT|nr:hypothetical protein [Dyadobacter luteus]REA63723.1 hypothetical protein DSL64_04640 [Dyadobacter luteus]
MKKIFLIATLLVFGFTAANAQYGPRDDRYRHDNRNDRYEDRDDRGRGHSSNSEINYLQREAREKIAFGIRSRQLTRREANMLTNRYERIEMKEREFSHRGRLSNRETKILRNDLRQLISETHRLIRRNDGWARGGRY